MLPGPTAHGDFRRFWFADALSTLGTFVSGLALQLLLIETMDADQTALGIVRSAQWLPYLLFGLAAGVVVDRMRRKPVLVVTDLVCAASFGAAAALALTGHLTVPLLAGFVFVVGAATTFAQAAHQSLLPRLVPATVLPAANARLAQTWTASQAAGPLVAGALVRFLSAPVAIVVDAASYLLSALVVARVRVDEPAPGRGGERNLRRELAEGARWVYRHRTLAPYAVSLHVWFFFNSLVTTVFVFYAATDLGLGAVTIGAVLACAGVSGVAGAGLAPALGRRLGPGRVYALAQWLSPVAYAPLLVASPATAVPLLVACQLLFGLGLGLQGPLDMTYRNLVTPDRLRARMNATIRSANWGSIAVSAPLGGWLAATWGNRPAIAVGVVGLVLAATIVTASPFRTAVMPEDEARAA